MCACRCLMVFQLVRELLAKLSVQDAVWMTGDVQRDSGIDAFLQRQLDGVEILQEKELLARLTSQREHPTQVQVCFAVMAAVERRREQSVCTRLIDTVVAGAQVFQHRVGSIICSLSHCFAPPPLFPLNSLKAHVLPTPSFIPHPDFLHNSQVSIPSQSGQRTETILSALQNIGVGAEQSFTSIWCVPLSSSTLCNLCCSPSSGMGQ